LPPADSAAGKPPASSVVSFLRMDDSQPSTLAPPASRFSPVIGVPSFATLARVASVATFPSTEARLTLAVAWLADVETPVTATVPVTGIGLPADTSPPSTPSAPSASLTRWNSVPATSSMAIDLPAPSVYPTTPWPKR
jgi:hypothetical protein